MRCFCMLSLLKVAIWGGDIANLYVTQHIYEELKLHAVESLPASIMKFIDMQMDIRKQWKEDILRQIAYCCAYRHEETHLPITVPYIVLKGSAAAKYYPHPEYRTMGDIDIITRREDFEEAIQQLMENGYHITKKLDREIGLSKNGIMVEVHRYFALLNDTSKAKYLDDLIIENITASHYLPDLINGLVLLEHIDQHMEGGIGLRQIIDWMMFVDKCLPDEKWPEFREMAAQIGLEELAVVTTRMCEIYLGLTSRAWSAGANQHLCKELMNYVLGCGNFGNKRIDDSSIVENAFTYARTPQATIKLLNSRGLANWKAAQKHRFLRPFAWIYQAFRYASRGLGREAAIRKLLKEHKAAQARNDLFDALGIKRVSIGRAVFKDGKYIKQ